MRRWSLLPLLCCTGLAAAQVPRQPWSIGARGHFGFLWPHRPSSWVLVQGHAFAAEVHAERRMAGDRAWHHHYLMPGYGFSLMYADMANPQVIGHTCRFVPYLFLPFVRGSRSAFGMRLGWGLGWVEKPWQRSDNIKQIAIATRLNTGIELAAERRHERGRLRVAYGLALDHWSNGSVRQPNLGLNLVTLFAGAGWALADAPPPPPRPDTLRTTRAPLEFSIAAAMAAQGTDALLSGTWPVYVLTGAVQRRFTPKSSACAGLDVFNKPGLVTLHPQLADDPSAALTQLGIQAGYALMLGRGEVMMRMGAYLHTPVPESAPLYHRFGLRYRTGRHLLWHLALKSHFFAADHWEFGIGYRWN